MVMTALDANGDGYWDVAAGDPSNDLAWVFMGGPSGAATTPAVTLSNGGDHGQFGYLLTGGDVDGDVYEDLAISAPRAPSLGDGSGRVYVFPGSSGGATTTPSPTIQVPGSYGWPALYATLSASGS
jgi:hypothetical protein